MKNTDGIEFQRKIYAELLAWAKDKDKNDAILIEGARRVGKTTIVQKLAREVYEEYLYIDFKIASDALKDLFHSDRMKDLDSFFLELFLLTGKTLKPGALIIFDEVQLCLSAREDIKYLVADGRYDYIETGSLITILSNEEGIQIPSEETILYMRPMDFEEYFWAMGDHDSLPAIRKLVAEGKKIPDAVHQKMMEAFRRYMVIGGMPQSLEALLKKKSYVESEKAKRRILSLYYQDLRKYDFKHKTFCELLFRDLPAQFARERESYRFIPNVPEGSKRSVKIMESIVALKDFMMCNVVHRSCDLSSFLESGKDQAIFKLYYVDIGLLLTALLSASPKEVADVYGKIIRGESGINYGGVMESAICQGLIAQDITPYYYIYKYAAEASGEEKRYELDFVFKYRLSNIIVEAKSGSRYQTSSLDNFAKKHPSIKAHRYVIGIKNFQREDNKCVLPVYLLPVWDFASF